MAKEKKKITSVTIDPIILADAQYNAWDDHKSLSEIVESFLDKYNKSKPKPDAKPKPRSSRKGS